MLNQQTIQQIESFVKEQPRSVNEIATQLKKNWRTIDRYLQQIEQDLGSIKLKTFRGGTRGALKIAYSTPVDQISSTTVQKQLEKEIFSTKNKQDFSAFDIYQHIPKNKKSVWTKKGLDESDAGRLKEYKELLLKAKKQIMFFSGNLSFINFKDKNIKIFDILEELIKRNIKIKVICKVDYTGIKNIEKLLSLNHKYAKDLIELHHSNQPLRATIIDDKYINLKEEKNPTQRKDELKQKTFIFYTINDKDWAGWITKIFFKMFNQSIDSKKRLEELNEIL